MVQTVRALGDGCSVYLERDLSLAPIVSFPHLFDAFQALSTVTQACRTFFSDTPCMQGLLHPCFLLGRKDLSDRSDVSHRLLLLCTSVTSWCPSALSWSYSGHVSLFFLVVSSCRAESGSDSSLCPQYSGQDLALTRELNCL